MSTHFAGTRVILEFIPNHTSNESDWFVKSVARDPCCEDFYVWRDGGTNDTTGDRIPPNDWVWTMETLKEDPIVPTGFGLQA